MRRGKTRDDDIFFFGASKERIKVIITTLLILKKKEENNNKSKQANKARCITQKTRYDKVQVYKYMKVYLRGISQI